MRFLTSFFVVSFMIFSLSTSVFASESQAQGSAKVAKVGNLLITSADVSREAQKLMPMQVSFHGKISPEKVAEINQEALELLVDRAYKVQYAINEELSIDGANFESDWQEKLDKNPQAVSGASKVLLSKYKSDMYLEQLARKAEKVAVNDKITVTDEAVQAYYSENKQRYFRPKLYSASHVFVKVDPAETLEEKKVKAGRAEELLERAKAGEDFYNLAYYESDDRSKYVGGSLGAFHAGQTVPEFDAAIQKMQPGEIVGPIRTIYGLHIIKLDSVDDERQMEFDEVAAKIRATMEEEQRSQLYDEWLSNLKEKYLLERFDQ